MRGSCKTAISVHRLSSLWSTFPAHALRPEISHMPHCTPWKRFLGKWGGGHSLLSEVFWLRGSVGGGVVCPMWTQLRGHGAHVSDCDATAPSLPPQPPSPVGTKATGPSVIPGLPDLPVTQQGPALHSRPQPVGWGTALSCAAGGRVGCYHFYPGQCDGISISICLFKN